MKRNLGDKPAGAETPTIDLAPTDEIEHLGVWIDEVLKALGHPDALVTDESWIGDFAPFGGSSDEKAAFLIQLEAKLGLPVTTRTPLVEVAKKLRERSCS